MDLLLYPGQPRYLSTLLYTYILELSRSRQTGQVALSKLPTSGVALRGVQVTSL